MDRVHKLAFFFLTVLAEVSLGFAGTGGELIRESGTRGGLVVHLGCADGRLTSELYAGSNYVVHGLDTDRENVKRARKYIRSLGLYGPVSADMFDGEHLPYSDNLVNLVVVDPHSTDQPPKIYPLAKADLTT